MRVLFMVMIFVSSFHVMANSNQQDLSYSSCGPDDLECLSVEASRDFLDESSQDEVQTSKAAPARDQEKQEE